MKKFKKIFDASLYCAIAIPIIWLVCLLLSSVTAVYIPSLLVTLGSVFVGIFFLHSGLSFFLFSFEKSVGAIIWNALKTLIGIALLPSIITFIYYFIQMLAGNGFLNLVFI